MAKNIPDAILDLLLAGIATADHMYVCSDQPANFAGIAAVQLADVALTPGDGNGDFTIGNGDTSGRKVAIAQQAAMSITGSGEADHIVLTEGGDTIIAITTCTAQTLTSGGTVTVPTFDAEVSDPT